jgi:dTDP-4-amino-4,6-dideoxygalactose transaminase
MILFNMPSRTGNEDKYVAQALQADKLSGDGRFTNLCQNWFEQKLGAPKTLMTPSGTAALEMAAMLISVQPEDEIIMPSYTFVSTANAFALHGARIVFVDVRPDTMNIDENLIEAAITRKTKAIVPVHYAGVSCEMDKIMAIAEKYNLFVIEDAAQGMMSTYKDSPLGTIGHLGAYSFHETKNFTSGGEGGLLIINDTRLIDRAEIIREKGTNRSKFFRGQVDKYTWVDIGGSYLPSELQAAYLWGQLEKAQEIDETRVRHWNLYLDELAELELIGLPTIPESCRHNGHMFYIKLANLKERTFFIEKLRSEFGVMSVFHYVPLHTAPAGLVHSRFDGADVYTSRESERLLRLPMWHNLEAAQIRYVAESVRSITRDMLCYK